MARARLARCLAWSGWGMPGIRAGPRWEQLPPGVAWDARLAAT